MKRTFLSLVVVLASGCSAYNMKADAGSSFGDSASVDTGDTEGDDHLDGEVAWWALGAGIQVTEGTIDLAATSLEIEARQDDGTPICAIESAPQSLTTMAEYPEGLGMVGWWLIQPGEWFGDCGSMEIESPVDRSFLLGVGAMHPEMVAVLGSVEAAADGSEETLNGAYASFDGGATIYIFGVAGPAEAFAAEGAPAEALPLADGVWTVLPIYPFAYRS